MLIPFDCAPEMQDLILIAGKKIKTSLLTLGFTAPIVVQNIGLFVVVYTNPVIAQSFYVDQQFFNYPRYNAMWFHIITPYATNGGRYLTTDWAEMSVIYPELIIAMDVYGMPAPQFNVSHIPNLPIQNLYPPQ